MGRLHGDRAHRHAPEVRRSGAAGAEIAPDNTPGTLADNPRDTTIYNEAGQVVAVRSRRELWTRMEYDALGRRVLVRTRQDFACKTRCFHQLRRAIWDGDQLLIEIAAPGVTGALPAQMERDTGLATPFKGASGYATFFETGRVHYVHGAELDAPLALTRVEYSDSIGGGYYIPLANWRKMSNHFPTALVLASWNRVF